MLQHPYPFHNKTEDGPLQLISHSHQAMNKFKLTYLILLVAGLKLYGQGDFREGYIISLYTRTPF